MRIIRGQTEKSRQVKDVFQGGKSGSPQFRVRQAEMQIYIFKKNT